MYELHGVKIPYDENIITPDVGKSIERGRYEKPEVLGLPKFIDPNDRVIELGSGLGFISTYLMKQLGVRNMMCIEAAPPLCSFIKRVHAENDVSFAEVKNAVALNDTGKPGQVDFYVRDPFWSSSLDPQDGHAEIVQVPALSLSEQINEFRANTLVVDIEGGEVDLFDPLDLSGVNKVYLEIHTRKIGLDGIRSCFDALSKQDFAYDQKVSSAGAVLFRKIPKRQLRSSQNK